MELRELLSLLFFGTVALSAQDSSNAYPPVSAADIRIVQRAREILDSTRSGTVRTTGTARKGSKSIASTALWRACD